MSLPDEEQKKMERMNIIYKALESGWSVKKSDTDSKAFEFTKNTSLNKKYKGLVVFTKNDICEDLEKHLQNIKKHEEKVSDAIKRSISTPIIKKDT